MTPPQIIGFGSLPSTLGRIADDVGFDYGRADQRTERRLHEEAPRISAGRDQKPAVEPPPRSRARPSGTTGSYVYPAVVEPVMVDA